MQDILASSLSNLIYRCGKGVEYFSNYVNSARYEKPGEMALIKEWAEDELVLLQQAITEALQAIKEHQSSDDK